MISKNFKICSLLVGFLLVQLLFIPEVYPASEIISASYKYTMGDNDTKNDAKRICFLEAKRLAIEKAGTYIESTTEIKNFQLTMDEIKTFAGAIVKVDITSEEIKFIGENPTIFMTVKAEVDIDSFRERVKQIKGDRELEKKIKEQQGQLQTMENRVKDLQMQLTAKDPDEVIKVRRERKEAFEAIDELEKIKLDIRTATKEATENIELGMTLLEVLKVFGQPRSVDYNNDGERRYNYGNVWVIFESGVVSCIVNANRFQKHNSCSWYRASYPRDVVK